MYIFAAGGTGGHIIPALAVASSLRRIEPDAEILFVGAGSVLEKELISDKFQLEVIEFVPVLGKGISGLLRMCLRLPLAICQAIALYRKTRPRAIIAFGGYPSFIPCLAAFFLRVPRILFEQNAKVGLANKFLGLLSTKIYAVPEAKGFIACSVDSHILNPLRIEFSTISKFKPIVENKRISLLVLGGSQGSQSINGAILEVANELVELGIEITHITGRRNFSEVSKAYDELGLAEVNVLGFSPEPWKLLEKADLVISRAGAMSATELLASGRAVIYIPLAIAAAHQDDNIAYQLHSNAALSIADDPNLKTNLRDTILDLVQNPQKLNALAENMHKLASSRKIADSAHFLAQKLIEVSS